ncbi:MAG: rhodanese-like domain-containing protein [Solirubrobacterales bacterium]
MEQVSPREAQRMVAEEGARLVDVREEYEWDEVRIPGAEHLPLSDYEADPEQLERARLTIFHCSHGSRSQTAIAVYEQVHAGAKAVNLDGGIAAWVDDGLPVDLDPPE